MTYVIGVELGETGSPTVLVVLEEMPRKVLHVRHLERHRSIAYLDLLQRLRAILGCLASRTYLAIDASGVGPPVIDIFRQAKLPAELYAITLTGGGEVAKVFGGRHIPMRDLISNLAVLFQTDRLKIAPELKEASALDAALRSVRQSSAPSGTAIREDLREIENGDLVLAVGLAAWFSERGKEGIIEYYRLMAEKAGKP